MDKDTDKSLDNTKCYQGPEIFYKKWKYLAKIKMANEENWNILYFELKNDYFTWRLTINQHYVLWWKLIRNFNLKNNEEEGIMECLQLMINSLPIGTEDLLHRWTMHVKGVHMLKTSGQLTEESYEIIMNLFEKKITSTYNKVGNYWALIRDLEEKQGGPREVYISKCIETYKKQFSAPYMAMDSDYDEFLKFVEENKKDVVEEDVSLIKSLYEQNAEEAMRITNNFMELFTGNNHHVKFEEWIEDLLGKTPPQIETALSLCEESLIDERFSVCYFFVYTKALVKIGNFEQPEVQTKLFKILIRAVNLASYECESTLFHFLDYALGAASSHLTSNMCRDLIHDIIITFTVEHSFFFDSRKALMFGIKHMVQNGKLSVEDGLQKIDDATKPLKEEVCIQDELSKEDPRFGLKRFEIIKLSLVTEKHITGNSWETIMMKLNDSVSNTTDPEVLVNYTSFVREIGTPAEAETAYIKTIETLSNLNSCEDTCTYRTRRCMLLMMNQLRELLYVHGGKSDTMSLINDISKRNSQFNMKYCESYHVGGCSNSQSQIGSSKVSHLLNVVPTASMNSDFAVVGKGFSYYFYPSTMDVDEWTPVITEMESLTVEEYKGANFGFPVFLSNINYKATKEDIGMAFKNKGLEVVQIQMKTTPNNTNCGYAKVKLISKEQAVKALMEVDGIEILGRKAFVNEYKEQPIPEFQEKKKSDNHQKKQATVIFLSGLPVDWRIKEKIEDALLPFGHIKSVELDDQLGSAKIEYHMPGDAGIGCLKLKEFLSGTTAQIRLGFLGPNRKLRSKTAREQIRQEESNDNTKSSELSIDTKNKNPFSPRTLKRFVPRQLRNDMKKRLDFTQPESGDFRKNTQTETPEDSEEPGPSNSKRFKTPPRPKGKQLSNSDFRNMFKR